MPLSRKYETETDIPPALREFYVQAEDGTWVLEVEGQGQDEFARLRRGIEHEREQRRKAIEDLTKIQEQYKDLDPERAREALTKIEELEQERNDSTTTNKQRSAEEQIAKRFERQIKDMQAQIAGLGENLKHSEARASVLRDRYAQVVIDDRLKGAFLEAGADPKRLQFAVQSARSSWQLNDEDEPVPMDEQGIVLYGADATKPLTMAEHARSFLKDFPFFALESSGGNTQQRGNGQQIGNVIKLTEAQARDVRTYRAAKEQAEKIGGTVELV